jgi:signal transduction histidine kinase
MTPLPLLNWLLLSVSLFDTILLLWLGLTVFLNAERTTDGRSRWGVWLAVGGLLMGALFFISHTAIVGHEQTPITPGLEFWWRVGWLPIALLPYTWYAIVLWYAGYWETEPNDLHHRQRPWFALASGMTLFLIATLIAFNPIPSFVAVAAPYFAPRGLAPMGIFWLAGFTAYLLLCVGLALDALRSPGPTARQEFGHAARRRARPWLTGTSLVLLFVCLLVAGAVAWGVMALSQATYGYVTVGMVMGVGWLDLLIASLIGGAVVLLGEAVVAYEIFTGKALPRRGLARYWRNAIILAAGFSLVVGASLTIHLRPIYSVIIAALLMTTFYALLSWRSYVERERLIEQLRPFVTSQQLYERLLTAEAPASDEMAAPFQALCADVLGVQRAALIPLGPLAALIPRALTYPEGITPPPIPATDLTTLAHPLDPAQASGMTWAISLGSARGLIGVLMLGEKQADGPYTQEEIEIARSAAERLLDTHASSELARRLMALQRQRLAETQVLDQRTRRLLHDDVLPRLHAALLGLHSDPDAAAQSLTEAHRQISNLLRELPSASPAVARLGLIGALEQVITDEMPNTFDEIQWDVAPEAEAAVGNLPPLTAEVVFYAAREAMRNAARHGRGSSQNPLHLSVALNQTPSPTLPHPKPTDGGGSAPSPKDVLPLGEGRGGGLSLQIEDNGVGLEIGGQPGGSGSGLALHSAMLAVVGGTLAIESVAGEFTRVKISLPER